MINSKQQAHNSAVAINSNKMSLTIFSFSMSLTIFLNIFAKINVIVISRADIIKGCKP